MKCLFCGKELPDGSKYCQFCGRKIETLIEKTKQVSTGRKYPDANLTDQAANTVPVDWYIRYGDGYFKNEKLYTGSNLIAVRVGDTVKLSVFNLIPKSSWVSVSNTNCDIKWGTWIDNKRTYIEVTGRRAGTAEVVFSTGDIDKRREAFRVFVIILDV